MTVLRHPITKNNNWNTSIQSGGKLLSIGQKLSLDGNYFIAVFKHQIKVYYLVTRQCIKVIPIDLTNINIINSFIFGSNPNLIHFFTKQGEIVTVNWKDKLLNSIISRSSLPISEPILKILSYNVATSEVIAISGYLSTSKSSSKSCHIVKLTLEVSENLLDLQKITLVASSSNNSNIVFLTHSNELISVSLSPDGVITNTQTIPFIFKSKVTSMAVSNINATIALGTASGIIQLIYPNNANKPQRLLKWHIDQVKTLEFNQDDTYLLSGGLEKVLVFWQLDTDKQQFLPRLNGNIESISIDYAVPQLYTITLNVEQTSEVELLILSASDLISRLTVHGVAPNFNLSSLNKLQKKLTNTIYEVKNDFTCSMVINPLTNHLYFANGSVIQVYDYRKDEQLFIQTAVSTIQTGKVKSEKLILDPKIELLGFSQDGKWMCTFDSVPTPKLDNLLSTKDVHYSLKFWKYIESQKDPKQSYWELSTKILDPHGVLTPIVSMIATPKSYHNGVLFLTADTKGGVRLWRPRIPKEIYNNTSNNNEKLQQTAWILKKSMNGNGTFETNSVSLSWSEDSSIIAMGYENLLNLIDANTFKELEDFHLPSLLGSRVRSVNIVDNTVIALLKNRLVSYDLLNAKNNLLGAKIQTPTNGKNLIAVNTNKKLIALVVNFFNKTEFNSRIFIFEPQSLKPVYMGHHNQYIASIVYSSNSDSFVFIDIDSRIGSVSSTLQEDSTESSDLNFSYELNVLLNNAKETVKYSLKDDDAMDIDITEESEVIHGKLLNSHSFDTILQNLEGIPVDSLFDRVMNVL